MELVDQYRNGNAFVYWSDKLTTEQRKGIAAYLEVEFKYPLILQKVKEAAVNLESESATANYI